MPRVPTHGLLCLGDGGASLVNCRLGFLFDARNVILCRSQRARRVGDLIFELAFAHGVPSGIGGRVALDLGVFGIERRQQRLGALDRLLCGRDAFVVLLDRTLEILLRIIEPTLKRLPDSRDDRSLSSAASTADLRRRSTEASSSRIFSRLFLSSATSAAIAARRSSAASRV